MAIQVGDKLPEATLKVMTGEGPKDVTTQELFGGKKVVLFAVPGAFTPTCSAKHLPGYVQKAKDIKAKGVDEVVCLSVNDVFVMGAWGEAHGAGDLVMAADPGGDLTRALGLEFDLSAAGLGLRSQRYAAVVDDGTVSLLNVEKGGKLETSDAETILAAL